MKKGWGSPTKRPKTITTMQSDGKKKIDFWDQFLGSHPCPAERTWSYKTKISYSQNNTNNGINVGGNGTFVESHKSGECTIVVCCLEMIFREIHNLFFKVTG